MSTITIGTGTKFVRSITFVKKGLLVRSLNYQNDPSVSHTFSLVPFKQDPNASVFELRIDQEIDIRFADKSSRILSVPLLVYGSVLT